MGEDTGTCRLQRDSGGFRSGLGRFFGRFQVGFGRVSSRSWAGVGRVAGMSWAQFLIVYHAGLGRVLGFRRVSNRFRAG